MVPSPTPQPCEPLTSRPAATFLLVAACLLAAAGRFYAHNFHEAGVWVSLSLAHGLYGLAQHYRRPALCYAAAGAIAMAVLMLGLAVGADHAARQAGRAATERAR